MAEITVYGANWCPDCRRAKRFLGEHRVPYEWVDVDEQPEVKSLVEERNNGAAIIPTIVFADGSHLAEPSNEELATKLGMVAHARRYGVELLSAVGIQGLHRTNGRIVVSTAAGDEYRGRAALIATGSSYRRLGVPGEEELIGAGIHFCATCDGPFYAGAEELMVIGGGNSGVEEGLFLAQFADRIRLVEFMPGLKASAHLQERARANPKFTLHTNTEVLEFRRGRRGKLGGVVARDRATGEVSTFTPAGAFVFVGLDPNTSFLRDTVELDRWGFVVTDDEYRTSVPGVFAAGDVRAESTKQLGAAVGEGIGALLAVRRFLEEERAEPELLTAV